MSDSIFGDFGVFIDGCIYVSGLIQAFLFYLCVFRQLLGSLGFLIVRGFFQLASLCGVLPLVSVRGPSNRSMVFSTFVRGGGGGGSVVIERLVYILRIVLLSWGYILCVERVG